MIIARPRARMLAAAGAAAVVLSGAAAFGPRGPDALALTEYSTPAIAVAGGNPVIAIQTSGDGLQFYRNQSGTTTWRGEPVTGNHSTYSAPSIAQDGSSVIIAAQGPDNSLDFYWQQAGATGWSGETVAGAGTTYSAPSLVVNGGGVNIVAQGSGNSLDFYWELNGTTAWHPVMVAGTGTTYSAPAVAANGGGANVVAEGPRNTLDFYWNTNGTPAWHPQLVAGVDTTYSAPAITGNDVTKISRIANGSARKFLTTLLSTGRPRQEQVEGGGYRRLPWLFQLGSIRSPDRRICWSWCCSCRTSCRPNRRSGPWNPAVPSTTHRQQPSRAS